MAKGCFFRDDGTIITPKELQSTNFNASYLPTYNISFPSLNKTNLIETRKFSNPIHITGPLSNDYLIHLIEQQKQAENSLPSKLNRHDVHHYVSNSLLFICLVVFICAFVAYYKGYSITKWCKKSKNIPISSLQTIYSIPTVADPIALAVVVNAAGRYRSTVH